MDIKFGVRLQDPACQAEASGLWESGCMKALFHSGNSRGRLEDRLEVEGGD